MQRYLRKILNVLGVRTLRAKHGPEGIAEVGHRAYVGGLWEEMGQLQFQFLVNQGLTPDTTVVDIACGSLRAGRLLVPYLDKGCYLGIEKEESLIKKGIEDELGMELFNLKEPELVVSSDFEFSRFTRKAEMGIAQSLYTHLPPPIIKLCMRRLSEWAQKDFVLYATYFQSDRQVRNASEPHDHDTFRYTVDEMRLFGGENGFEFEYIGDWKHPRKQVMVKYHKC